MSTKPADAGRFAVDGSDVNATNISTPSAGLRNTGFTLDYVPPSSEMNYLENVAYRWRQWLNDGDCAFHNLSAAGTLNVTGATALGDTLTVGGQPLTFVSFTFTLTDPDLDGNLTMHAVAHGRSTGDGPVRPSNLGGGLPAPLSAGTDYWIVRLGADDLILATSLKHALAGTGIIFTTSGSGTQSVNATGGTESVKDATVTRNLTVGGTLDADGHGEKSRTFTLFEGQGTNWAIDTSGVAPAPIVMASVGSGVLGRGLSGFNVGDRIRAFEIQIKGDAAVDVVITVAHQSISGVQTALGVLNESDVPAAYHTLSVNLRTLAAHNLLADGDCFLVTVSANASGCLLTTATVTYDHPPS